MGAYFFPLQCRASYNDLYKLCKVHINIELHCYLITAILDVGLYDAYPVLVCNMVALVFEGAGLV
jgi:uncharacterized protein with PQ loop repeat